MTRKTNTPFLWGAATAAHQVEGNNRNQWTEWETKTANAKAADAPVRFSHFPIWDSVKHIAVQPDTYLSGSKIDHYHLFEEDFALLSDMHMNAYRFSVEWSRIEPEEGTWDLKEIEHYRAYIQALRKRNIEPVLTLFHFSLPVWFAERGGFEKKSNIAYFLRFAKKLMTELRDEVTYVITINEPEVYTQEGYITPHFPPQTKSYLKAWCVFNALIHAHRKTYTLLKGINPDFKVSLAKNSAYYYAGDARFITKLAVRLKYYLRDDYFLKRTVKQCDFLGVNYYFSNRVVGMKVDNLNEKVHDLGWSLSPVDIEKVITRLYRKYQLPIFITENGLADQADIQRKWWLEETLKGMEHAQAGGAELIGYLHWSLIDNFEWGFGIIPRFGLASVDYETNERTLRPSGVWFGEYIRQHPTLDDRR
jgi:beta-glucosidase